MFERYTEKARRTIFFGRYEASQFGSIYIEPEHLLLGLLREDWELAARLLGSRVSVEAIREKVEAIREKIESHTPPREKIPTSVDLPLSHQCKRALAYAAEEAERLNHKYIGNEHLLLGLLREEHCFAAKLLTEQGVTLHSMRQQVQQRSVRLRSPGGFVSLARLDEWLANREATGGIYAVKQKHIGNRAAQFALYASDRPNENETAHERTPAEQIEELQNRIDLIVAEMENAIANHEFQKARFHSDEERKERESLRRLREQFHLEELPRRLPLLCIDLIRDDRFSDIQQRCDDYLAEGVPLVWLLNPELKRAYIVTKAEGLQEFRGDILQLPNPPLEMDLRTIFG